MSPSCAGSLAALLTSFYSWRLILLTFCGQAPLGRLAQHRACARRSRDRRARACRRGTTDSAHADADPHGVADGTGGYHPHESPPSMLIPLALLALGAVFAGWLGHTIFTDPERAARFWNGAIAFAPARYSAIEAVPAWVSMIPTGAWALGLLIALNSYVWNPDIPASFAQTWRGLYQFLVPQMVFRRAL